MQIATWNINGLKARLDFVRHWLDARAPDVVGLQELKAPDERFPHEAFAECGYTAISHGQPSWNGVAVLVRSELGEPEPVAMGLPGQEELGARLLSVRVASLLFTTVYCPNGKNVTHEDFPKKLAWFDALHAFWADTVRDEPAILCGDFNLCPAAIDSWNEEELAGSIFHTEEERSRFEALLELGLTDLYRHCHPDGNMFSWWDYRAGAFHRNMGLRIDLLLGTRQIVGRVEEVVVDRDYRKKKEGLIASDHAPVIATLQGDGVGGSGSAS